MSEITVNSEDAEIMQRFEELRRAGNGEAIGNERHSPEEAVAFENWERVRSIFIGTNCPGRPVLARDPRGNLWVVNDIYGPWAIQVSEAAAL